MAPKKSDKTSDKMSGRVRKATNPTPRGSGTDDRLRSVIESAVDAIITIDDRGMIETVNPAVEKLFGYAPHELIGKNINILMPSPYHEEHDSYLKNYLRTGKPKIIGIGREVVARRKDGTTFPIDLAVSEFRHGAKRMFTGMIRDISARKEMEAHLEEREQRMRSIVETAVDGIFTIDPSGTIHTMNPAAERIFGYRSDELIGENVNLLMPEPYHSEHDGYIQNYLRTGKAKIIGIGREVVARKKDGTLFPIDLAVSQFRHGNQRMFTGIVRDISARKRSEMHLHLEHEVSRILAESPSINAASSQILQAMCKNLECTFGEFFLIDDAKGELRCIEFWTSSSRNLKEYERYFLGKTFISGSGVPGKVWAQKKPIWVSDVFADDNFSRKDYAREIGIQTALGIPILFKEEVIGVMDLFTKEKREPDQQLLDMMGSVSAQIGQFIERKRIETQLKGFDEKFRQGEKLMVLGMLASEIAHEIGTPLNIISGRVELIGVRENKNEQLQKELATINQQIERINKIVRQHLNVLRKSEIEQRVELNTLLNSLALFFHPYAEKSNIDLHLSLSSAPVVRGNQDQLQQVFINLMMNAIQEMQGGGKLTVHSEVLSKDGKRFAEVRIQDTGKGISPEVLDKIFEPFFSTKSQKGGTGLGLAIVQDIVKRHRGEIVVDTVPSKGTTFCIRIPSE